MKEIGKRSISVQDILFIVGANINRLLVVSLAASLVLTIAYGALQQTRVKEDTDLVDGYDSLMNSYSYQLEIKETELEKKQNELIKSTENYENNPLLKMNDENLRIYKESFIVIHPMDETTANAIRNTDIAISKIYALARTANMADEYGDNIEDGHLRQLVQIERMPNLSGVSIAIYDDVPERLQKTTEFFLGNIKNILLELNPDAQIVPIELGKVYTPAEIDNTYQTDVRSSLKLSVGEKRIAVQTASKELAELKKQDAQMKIPEKSFDLTKIIVFGIGVFIVFLFAAAMGVFVYVWLFRRPILSRLDLEETGEIKVLQVMKPSGKCNWFFRLFSRFLYSEQSGNSQEISIKIMQRAIQLKIAQTEAATQTIAVCIDSKEVRLLEQAQPMLQTLEHITACDALTNEIEALQIEDAAGVVLVKQIGTSSLRQTQRELTSLALLGKDIIGVVLFYA